jgi:hypothetical protein
VVVVVDDAVVDVAVEIDVVVGDADAAGVVGAAPGPGPVASAAGDADTTTAVIAHVTPAVTKATRLALVAITPSALGRCVSRRAHRSGPRPSRI